MARGVTASKANSEEVLCKVKSKIVPVHTMKEYYGLEVQIHSLIKLTLRRCEWPASSSGLFTSGKEPWYPQNIKLGGPLIQSGHFGVEKNLLLLPGNEKHFSKSYLISVT